MGRPKSQPTSLKAYFEGVFLEHQDWLKPGTNEAVIDQWKKDHPGQDVTNNIKASLSNAKTRIRSKLGMGPARRRKKRRKGAAAPEAAPPAPRVRISVATLEKLEDQIDRCLWMARDQESAEFDGVIKSLRAARRGVVWMIGEPGRG